MNTHDAARILGQIGGRKGGESKRRSAEHYRRMALLSWKDKRRPISERFWEKVNKASAEECWHWKSCSNPLGYGVFGVKNKTVLAHRVAYELTFGEIPAGIFVCHKCDNPRCVNPSHLFTGTQRDNLRDAFQKGRNRGPKGELNASAKLKSEEIENIRNSTLSRKQLQEKYCVSKSTIAHVIQRRTWRHIK